MVYVLKDFSQESFTNLLEKIKKKNKRRKKIFAAQNLNGSEYQESTFCEWKKKNVAKYFGSLKWEVDGVEYQKTVRSESAACYSRFGF